MNPNEFITRYQSLIATCEYTCVCEYTREYTCANTHAYADETQIDRLIQGTRSLKARQRIIYMEMPKRKKVTNIPNAEYLDMESTSPSLPCLDARYYANGQNLIHMAYYIMIAQLHVPASKLD